LIAMKAPGDGFLFGVVFGAGAEVHRLASFAEAATQEPGERLRWLHLDWRGAGTQRWLQEQAALDPVAVAAALDGTVRPRVAHFGDALLVVLRAVKSEAGADHTELGSLRLLALPGCLVTMRRDRARSVEDVQERALASPAAFRDAADLIVALTARVQDRLQELLEELADQLDELEERVAAPETNPERSEIADLRRRLIALRKSLVPQRDALLKLVAEVHALLGKKHEKMLREEAQRAARLVDDVESSRERTVVLMEELAVESTERLNRRIYFFTVIAAIFLPLTFMVSALGMNVGGIPFAEHPSGFLAVVGLLGLLGFGIWLWLRGRRWV
jgi:zinc transporter